MLSTKRSELDKNAPIPIERSFPMCGLCSSHKSATVSIPRSKTKWMMCGWCLKYVKCHSIFSTAVLLGERGHSTTWRIRKNRIPILVRKQNQIKHCSHHCHSDGCADYSIQFNGVPEFYAREIIYNWIIHFINQKNIYWVFVGIATAQPAGNVELENIVDTIISMKLWALRMYNVNDRFHNFAWKCIQFQ